MAIVFYLKCFQMLSYDGLSQKPLLFKSYFLRIVLPLFSIQKQIII